MVKNQLKRDELKVNFKSFLFPFCSYAIREEKLKNKGIEYGRADKYGRF